MAGGNHEIRERLSSVEALLSAVPNGEDVCNLVARILNLEANFEQTQESLLEEMAQLRKNNEDLRYEIIVLRRAMASSVEAMPQRPLVRVPEPKSFGGTRSAKELENFLWDMEQHFGAPETEKVTISSMYLIGDAKLWWRTRMVDDANADRQKIDTWDRLKKEMKDQFLPGNTFWIARDGLKRLKQSGSVRDYVKEFSSLMLDIQNMSEEDKLYNFLYGLQPWAQVELRRQNVKDLPSAIVVADALVDLRMSKENLNTSSSSKSNFVRKDKKGDWKKEGKKDAKRKDSGNNHGKGKAEHVATRGKDNWKNQGCFLCNGPHFAKDCPKREKLNALLLGHGAGSFSTSAHFCDVKREKCKCYGGYRGTHTFVSAKLVQGYGLSISKCPRYIKSVNAKAQAVVGMSYNVPLTVGTWVGKANMMVWRIYLLATRFLVRTDNVANTFFATQKKLSPKQARWQEFLAEYDFAWEHKPGRHNQVADALSRKEVFASFYSISRVESDMLDRIKDVAPSDTTYGKLVQQGGRVFVSAAGGLQKELLKETHDPQWAGHPGVERLLALLARSYIWPKMENDVEAYVKTCLVWQQDKTERKKEAGLLQPLPISEIPWVSVSMDFISGLQVELA
ncbi:hypothetical protein ZIOFF_010756 [Zingiber officinale]|uniref:Retrotransposon gag domain-containing protein n=1 Tax=Zingiber officinale TaxID=94328 RepID=A0A8J5I1M7_ZINOF|nr:hypothetical protein ZIOFF_010756 [Zingiber officinale]